MSPLDFMSHCPAMRKGKLQSWEENDCKSDSQMGLQRQLSHQELFPVSSRGPMFQFPAPVLDVSQLPVTPTPRDPMAASGLQGLLTCKVFTHTDDTHKYTSVKTF